jgi:hypothetical protein
MSRNQKLKPTRREQQGAIVGIKFSEPELEIKGTGENKRAISSKSSRIIINTILIDLLYNNSTDKK